MSALSFQTTVTGDRAVMVLTGEADAPRVVEGMSEGPREFELVDVLTADGDLFTRYRPRR